MKEKWKKRKNFDEPENDEMKIGREKTGKQRGEGGGEEDEGRKELGIKKKKKEAKKYKTKSLPLPLPLATQVISEQKKLEEKKYGGEGGDNPVGKWKFATGIISREKRIYFFFFLPRRSSSNDLSLRWQRFQIFQNLLK